MSKRIADLFDKQTSPPEPPVTPRRHVETEPSRLWNTIALIALVATLAVLVWQRNRPDDARPQPQPDDQQQVEPQPQPPRIKGKTLVFIHERNPQSIEHDLLLREMPAFCAAHNMQFRVLDDDLDDEPVPTLKAFAKLKGIDPPFVVMTDQDDQPARVMKWPTEKNGLEVLFK